MADPAAVVAENRLIGQPTPTAPNQVWVGAISYLPLVGGRWCYLATWRDTYSRRVVGWHHDQHMPPELMLGALEQALTRRQPAPDLLIHADVSDAGASPPAVNIPARLAGGASKKPTHWLAIAGQVTPMITPRARPVGVRSKRKCYPTAACLPAWKRPAWRSPITSTRTSTSTAATPRWATARRINSNATSKPAYLSALSVSTGPPQHRK